MVILLGSTGYIGQEFKKQLEEMGESVCCKRVCRAPAAYRRRREEAVWSLRAAFAAKASAFATNDTAELRAREAAKISMYMYSSTWYFRSMVHVLFWYLRKIPELI